MKLHIDEIDSPIGALCAVTTQSHLIALDFEDCRERMSKYLSASYGEVNLHKHPDPLGVCTNIQAYLDGNLDALDDIDVEPRGTPFQLAVWRELRRIPVGETRSYGQLAARLGQPGASRAVGMANHRNPIGIVVPCHRVIGADGKLTGYAGGVTRKQWLLEHEKVAGQLALDI